MSNFKIGVLIVFGIFSVIAAVLFAGVGGFVGPGSISRVSVWGTVDEGIMQVLFRDLRSEIESFAIVTYEEIDERTLERDFVEALASGTGPDLILLPHDFILEHQNKIIVIPYESYGERTFKDTFIEEGELFLTSEGVLGLPFSIDPMVMYWNRNIFSSAGVANPPVFWDELFVLSSKMTERDNAQNIILSTVALGEFENIDHAKEILSALIIQAGSPLVIREEESGKLKAVLNTRGEYATPPAEAALRFYTEFSNPVKSVYSWNRSLSQSRHAFIAGDLALYFGFASELPELRQANPNLNFDVALLPQSRDSRIKSTFGNIHAFAIPRTSLVPSAAFGVASVLTSKASLSIISDSSVLPPVRRDMLSKKPTDAFDAIFYNSAIMSRAWLDPGREESDRIFKNMIEGVTSGRFRLSDAVNTANSELTNILKGL